MQRSTERMLTTHTGSLPRTAAVLAMLERETDGEPVEPDAFSAAVSEGVRDVVGAQVAAGVAVVNDGEMSKFSFASYHVGRLSGFTMREVPPPDPATARHHSLEADDYPEFFEHWAFNAQTARGNATVPVCTGPLVYQPAAVERDIATLQAAAAASGASEAFMSAVPPTGPARGLGANEYYATEEDYRDAMAEALRVEYEAIVGAGIVLQFDCNWGTLSRSMPLALDGVRSTIAANIELMNHATRNIDPDMMRIHLCWGADEAPHHRDLPLGDIVDLMLTARPNGLGVVASNGRHEWEWRVWKELEIPDGKVIIPGVIDSTTNIIEHPETVAERIVRFANVLGRENVIAGVDCGLDTIAGSAQVMPRIAWAKLAALGEGAQLASARLY